MQRVEFASHPGLRLSRHDFSRFSDLVFELTGINLSPIKKTLLEARLLKRLRNLGFSSYGAYLDHLLTAEGMRLEGPHFIDVVTTNKTDFFREIEHFHFLQNRILLQFFAAGHATPLRIWSAGCSSGEEPYSIAMALAEEEEKRGNFTSSIFASDISGRMLEHARRAIFDEDKAAGVPPLLRRKYFMRSKDRSKELVRVVPEIRSRVEFARVNLIRDEFRFAPFHVIFCRNVIIYFDKQTQRELLSRLEGMLEPGGYLFLGHSETLNGVDVSLQSVAPTIYRKPGTFK